jgi:hypothetical protein
MSRPQLLPNHRGTFRGSMERLLATFVLGMVVSACGSSSPPTAPTPAPTQVALTGTVSATGGGRIAGAIVRIIDGPNAAQTATTNSTGEFAFQGLTPGNANVSANSTIYDEVILGMYVNGTNTLSFVFAVPSCQTNNTASISFGNRSTTSSQDIVWNGSRVFTLVPGQTSDPLTVAAGVAHTLQFRVGNTQTLACSTATPILGLCERGLILTCSGP